MIATVAARGKRFQPRLVTGLRDPETGKVSVITPQALPGIDGFSRISTRRTASLAVMSEPDSIRNGRTLS